MIRGQNLIKTERKGKQMNLSVFQMIMITIPKEENKKKKGPIQVIYEHGFWLYSSVWNRVEYGRGSREGRNTNSTFSSRVVFFFFVVFCKKQFWNPFRFIIRLSKTINVLCAWELEFLLQKKGYTNMEKGKAREDPVGMD